MNRKRNGQIINCQVCNKEVYFEPSRLIKNKNRTCSRVCLSILIKSLCTTKIINNCPICKKIIRSKPFHRNKTKGIITCSRDCRAEYLRVYYKGSNNPNFKYENYLEKYFSNKLTDLKSRAKTNNFDFNLTTKDLVDIYDKQGGKCFYSGMEMKLKTKCYKNQPDIDVLSVDRLNSKVGYVQGNIILCLNGINKMKGNMELYPFIKFICKLRNLEDVHFYE